MSRNPGEIHTKSTPVLRLGHCEFDLGRKELRTIEGILVPLRVQSAEVLAVLGHNPNEIVEKDALITKVWHGTFVTDDSLVQCIADIRRALGGSGREIVQTFPKKGYRLNVVSIPVKGSALPSIAVMAFDDLSNGADHGFLSDAICEGVTTELTRFSEFSVVARNSSFKFRGGATDIRLIGVDLGVHYVLEGSQQKDADRLRVTAQLIDAKSGKHVWAETYEREIADIFATQAEIVSKITSAVGSKIAFNPPPAGGPNQQSAMNLHLEARSYMRRNTREATEKARDLNLQAIDVDPNSPFGYSGMAFVCCDKLRWSRFDGSRADLLFAAKNYSDTALEIDPDSYAAYYARGRVHQHAGELDQAVTRMLQAKQLNPNSTNVMAGLTDVLILKGLVSEALVLIETAIRLDPHHFDWYHWSHASALWLTGDCQAALAALQRMGTLPYTAQLYLAAIYVGLDRQAALALFLQHLPDYTLQKERAGYSAQFANPESGERWIAALRQAGLPE